jgi:hypothetical protein
MKELWAVLDSKYQRFCNYTSIEGDDISAETDVPTEPIENGKLAAYNKIIKPFQVKVTLLFDGAYSNQEQALAQIEAARQGTALFIVVTPSQVFKNCSLVNYDYTRSQSGGAHLLAVDCSFSEILSVNQNKGRYVPKNPTSANKVAEGKKQSASVLGNGSNWAINRSSK